MKNNRETWKAILQIIGSIIKNALYEEKEDVSILTHPHCVYLFR